MDGALLFLLLVMPMATTLSPRSRKAGILDEDQLMTSMKTYSFEDFFWTGSGDGPFPPDPHGFYVPSVISTKTILATVYIDSPDENFPDSDEDCLTECPLTPRHPGDISPTKPSTTSQSLPDPSYWLLTVLRAPAPPISPNFEKSLARLYKKAFTRQQERHLGISPTTSSMREKHHLQSTNKSLAIEENLFDEFDTSSTPETSIDEDISMREEIDDDENNFEYIGTFLNTTPLMEARGKRSISQASNSSDLVKRSVHLAEPVSEVEVFLYNISKENEISGDSLKVIYWVAVGGRPVPAKTAAKDMLLLADSEVAAELGYPVTTKAEPYLKAPEPTNGVTKLSNTRDLWIIIGASVLAVCIILATISLLTCRMVNRRKSASGDRVLSTSNVENKQYFINNKGKDNPGFIPELPLKPGYSPMKKPQITNEKFAHQADNVSDSCDSSSTLSDISQMTATLKRKQKLFEQQIHNEYSVINKKNKYKNKKLRSRKVGATKDKNYHDVEIPKDGTLQQFTISDGSSQSSSSCDSIILRKPSGIVSPTSYLSMPSVKSFPRGNAVEPLSRVLEPLSVRHLDIDTDSPVHTSRIRKQDDKNNIALLHSKTSASPKRNQIADFTFKYGSIDKDPGVVSPIIWDMHCKRMQESKTDGSESTDNQTANISKMRKRFNELVDDAFSLFGSGNNSLKSPPDLPKCSSGTSMSNKFLNVTKNRRHSNRDGEFYDHENLDTQHNRPHTALPQRPPLPSLLTSPSSAWGSSSTVEMGSQKMQSTKTTSSNIADPSLPLLKAIKKELDKLPGTSDA